MTPTQRPTLSIMGQNLTGALRQLLSLAERRKTFLRQVGLAFESFLSNSTRTPTDPCLRSCPTSKRPPVDPPALMSVPPCCSRHTRLATDTLLAFRSGSLARQGQACLANQVCPLPPPSDAA